MAATQVDLHPLDAAVWSSLTGPHAHFAQGTAKALRYPSDVSPFVAIPPAAGADAWAAMGRLAEPGEVLALFGGPGAVDLLPAGWEIPVSGEAFQLVATDAFISAPDPEAVVLGADDAEEMLDLTERTEPGPFLLGTHRLGTYLGIRRNGALVAMAGERFHPPGWTEISAVCTDPAFRGQGLASRLVRAVGQGIRDRGETPLMHASVLNTNALRLYDALGFVPRRRIRWWALRVPERA